MHDLAIRGLEDIGTPLARDIVGTPAIGRGRRIGAQAGMLRDTITIGTIQATGTVVSANSRPFRATTAREWLPG